MSASLALNLGTTVADIFLGGAISELGTLSEKLPV